MPQKCVNLNSCGTHSPGWFEGSLPSVPGEISSGKACFNWIGNCCHFFTPVRVKNCDGFFIYELPPTPLCDLQYCGDGVAGKDRKNLSTSYSFHIFFLTIEVLHGSHIAWQDNENYLH